ncbi:hypothetical protein [Kitasatospora sp. NPDC093806]|uniref:hypothetical protein n=1 Tax=Kitasatospora sp. NPDC093806 TaxID=3155075 RepID=UPI0034296473
MTDEGLDGPAAHQPGDPTPVVASEAGCLRAIGDFLLDLVTEAVGGAVLAVVTTGSLVVLFVGAELAHRRSPALAYGLGVLAVAVIALGVRQLRRPKERRGRLGRVLAAVTAGLGVWLLPCVGYASLRTALDLATF